MAPPKFTVAICGGGVAGLAAAVAISHFSLERRDILVDLYESSPSFTEIGAGIGMYRRPWRVVKALGLENELRNLTKIPLSDDELMPIFELRKANQTQGVTFQNTTAPFGIISFHRADFQGCLTRLLDPNVVRSHFSKRLVKYSLPPPSNTSSGLAPITLWFKDGSTAHCDMLIGADGIHSSSRHAMLELATQDLNRSASESDTKLADILKSPGIFDPIWTGTVAYRSLVPRERLESINPDHRALNRHINYAGKNKHIISFPISQGRFINVVAFSSQPEKEGFEYNGPWVVESDKAEVAAEYEIWEGEARQLIDCMDKVSRWAIHTLNSLPICTHDRVAIIGDAAHAMTPHLGSGAGVAIEDAYILGALLAHPGATLSTIPQVLKAHESVCLPHGNEVQRRSKLQGQLYEFYDPRYSSLADREILSNGDRKGLEELESVGDAIVENRKWGWETEAGDNLARAIRLFETEMKREALQA